MSFWEDLSPLVKRYIIVVVVLIVAALAVRACSGPQAEGKLPPRGAQQ